MRESGERERERENNIFFIIAYTVKREREREREREMVMKSYMMYCRIAISFYIFFIPEIFIISLYSLYKLAC